MLAECNENFAGEMSSNLTRYVFQLQGPLPQKNCVVSSETPGPACYEDTSQKLHLIPKTCLECVVELNHLNGSIIASCVLKD